MELHEVGLFDEFISEDAKEEYRLYRRLEDRWKW
jgi:hypothetical protein